MSGFDLVLDLTDTAPGEQKHCPLCFGELTLERRGGPDDAGTFMGYYRCALGHSIGVPEQLVKASVRDYEPNELPSPELLEEIPSIAEADRRGVDTAYLRYYNPAGRGEWLVLGFDPPKTAFVWVTSPLGKGEFDERFDELGNIDLTALDYYARYFEIAEIVLDETFTPRPFKVPSRP